MDLERRRLIRSLFDEYIEMYASRDERLVDRFSRNFSGYTGGGAFLVTDREEWIRITRQDFAEVTGRIGIEILDVALQDISDDVAVVTAFFHIHLPMKDCFLSRETARLVLVFRREDGKWMITHSGISAPYRLIREGEIFPLAGVRERNRELEKLVKERTQALKEANEKLEALSNTDGLTGIANRRHFDRVFGKEWNRSRRAETPLALIMIDVDHFKLYNDCQGHLVGDACLKTLAETLTSSERRAGHLVARYGGEEFVMLLPGTDSDAACETARHIRAEIRALALPHPGVAAGSVTVSLGVASLYPMWFKDPDELIRAADEALYRAKQNGRDRIETATACNRLSPSSGPDAVQERMNR